MRNILIVKLSDSYGEIPTSQEGLQERARGAWKRKIDTVKDVNYMIVLREQEVIAEYSITGMYEVEENGQIRIMFDLSYSPQFFVGEQVDYPTANVASSLDVESFKNIIK